jgi:hypothetical protein
MPGLRDGCGTSIAGARHEHLALRIVRARQSDCIPVLHCMPQLALPILRHDKSFSVHLLFPLWLDGDEN